MWYTPFIPALGRLAANGFVRVQGWPGLHSEVLRQPGLHRETPPQQINKQINEYKFIVTTEAPLHFFCDIKNYLIFCYFAELLCKVGFYCISCHSPEKGIKKNPKTKNQSS